MRRLSVGVATVIVAVVAAGGSSGQQGSASQAPTFRERADVVQLDVSVLDRQGLPARGLTRGDFTILEDGVPQPLLAFTEVEVPTWSPGTAAWMQEVAPDVASNRRDARRVVVIVLDDFNTRWDPGKARTARETASATVDHLGPADLAAVVYVVNRSQGQEFTVDRSRLRAAVERFAPSGLGPQPDSKFAASTPGGGLTMPSHLLARMPSGACRDDCVRMALRNAAAILRSWPGVRKTVVLISPGRYSTDSDTLDRLAEGDPLRETFAAMQEANINVYQYDPHGLQVEFRPSDEFGQFADATGGRAITNTNAPDELVPQMFRENSSYYLLGFQSANRVRDGRFRRIEIRVNRPDVEVRARNGYYAPSDRPAGSPAPPVSPVDQALSGGLPSGDLPISLTVVPFAAREKPGAGVAVLARADLDQEPAAADEVELVAVAFDERWREVAAARGRFIAPAEGPLTRRPAEMGLRLNLEPGRYEIRAAVTSLSTQRTGSVYTSVTVPNFASDRLSLSGIVLDRNTGGAALTDNLAGVMPERPTTERRFSPGEHVVAAVRVYQGGRRRLEPVRVETHIVDEDGRVALREELTLEPAAFGDQRQAGYRLDLPFNRLAAGEHLVTIEVTAGEESARGDIRFSVRP